jgi:hypothetical protein
MKTSQIVAVIAIVLMPGIALPLDDTASNRRQEADRHFSKNPLGENLKLTVDQLSQALPTALRERFKNQMIANIDIAGLEGGIKEAMVKHFTTEEIRALADSDAPSVNRFAEKQVEAYEFEVMLAFRKTMNASLAKTSPDIVDGVFKDGLLAKRVENFYSAVAGSDLKTVYEMQIPAIRRNMTFEGWKKDSGLEEPQQESSEILIQGGLEKICFCAPWEYPDGLQTLRCTLLVLVKTEESGGRTEANRLLEMWETENGEWFHGYTDHHEWENCPN